MTPTGSVHAGLPAVPSPAPVRERHHAIAPERGTDGRVTTQVTTQILPPPPLAFVPIVQGVPGVGGLCERAHPRSGKILEKFIDSSLIGQQRPRWHNVSACVDATDCRDESSSSKNTSARSGRGTTGSPGSTLRQHKPSRCCARMLRDPTASCRSCDGG